MAKLKISQIESGMILAEDVYDEEGLLLVANGTKLLEIHIDFIKRKNVKEIYIKDLVMEQPLAYGYNQAERPYTSSIKQLEKQYIETIQSFKRIYQAFKLGRVPVAQEIEDIIEPMYDAIINDESFAHKMWQIQTNDEYTFDHSVRVSMVSGLLAKWCKYDNQIIKEAALAGFLHDVGKCNIPDEILNKPASLDDEEFKVMKTHAILGYLLVKEMRNLSPDVQLGVLQHHERMDGTGYPHGIKSNEINDIAKIVAVADVYCAMTQERVYKKAMHPFEVMSFILEKCSDSLDFSISKTFLSKIAHFYIGHQVVLNNGKSGEVIMTYKDDPARPLIRIDDQYIDLRRELSLDIVSVFEE